MAEEIKKIIQVDTSQSVKSIKQLRTEVAALTDEIEDLEIGSSDYASKIKELTSVQNELDVATQSMQGTTINSVKAFDSLNQIAGGLAGGISAVSATFTLFGKDSENLQKTMVKLQAAIAIVQGIGGLKGLGEGVLNAVKSFKALGVSMTAASVGTKGLTVSLQGMKAALVSTGIGALIVGLGLLVEKLISAKQSANELSDVLDRVARQRKVDSIAIENIAVGLEDRLLALDLQERRRLISKEERLKKEQELYKEAIEVLDDYNGFTSKTFAQIDSLILRSDGTKKLIQTLGYDWKD